MKTTSDFASAGTMLRALPSLLRPLGTAALFSIGVMAAVIVSPEAGSGIAAWIALAISMAGTALIAKADAILAAAAFVPIGTSLATQARLPDALYSCIMLILCPIMAAMVVMLRNLKAEVSAGSGIREEASNRE